MKHKGNCYARFVKPSKFDGPTSPTLWARSILQEGDKLRKKIADRRILEDAPAQEPFNPVMRSA